MLLKNILKTTHATAMIIAGISALTFGAQAETTECTEITALPAVINTQGIFCFKQNLVTAITTGSAITINKNNVTIDMNGFKLGGQAAGAATIASGISAVDRKNITLRNGSIRGFFTGIKLDGTTTSDSSGHLIHDVVLDGNTNTGIKATGRGMIIRNNRIINTGPGTANAIAFGISVLGAENSVISGNLVSGVNETLNVFGIAVQNAFSSEVRDNSIFEIGGSPDNYGILVGSSEDILVGENRVINDDALGGFGGIQVLSSSTISCVGNFIDGYANAISNCNHLSGNVTP